MSQTILVLSRGIAEISSECRRPFEVYHEGSALEKDLEDLAVGDALLVAKVWTSGDYETLVGRLLERCPRFADLYYTVFTPHRKSRWGEAIAHIPQQEVHGEGDSLENRLSAYLADQQEYYGTNITRTSDTIRDWIAGKVMAPSHREVVEALAPLAESLSYFLEHWETIETLRLAQSVGSSIAYGIKERRFLRWRKHETAGGIHGQGGLATQVGTQDHDETLLREIFDYIRLTTGEQIGRDLETAVIEEIIPCSEGQHLPRQLQEKRKLTVVPHFPGWVSRRSYPEINLERSILQELTKKIIIPYLVHLIHQADSVYGGDGHSHQLLTAMVSHLSWCSFLASYSFVGKPAMHLLGMNEISLEHISGLSPREVAEIRRIYRHFAKATADDVRTGAIDNFYATQPGHAPPQEGIRSVVSFMRRWGRTAGYSGLHEGDTARLLLHYNKLQSAMPACFWEYQALYGLQQLWEGNTGGVTLEEHGDGTLGRVRRATRVRFERALRKYAKQELGSNFTREELSSRLERLEYRLAERYGIAPALDNPPPYREQDINGTLRKYNLQGFRGRLQPTVHA
ncbi:hypothetical protein HYW21_08580 [Candidatus Woesearchaeota archaeon]|nr:hypothetical protein [Candidatus Woesearchaeota archaeon]